MSAIIETRPVGRWSVVELDGRGDTYAYEHPGPATSAPTVVLLHGWTATGTSNWAGTLQAIAERYHVLALDHRGHGRGIRSATPFTLEDCADDVVALLDAKGVERATLIGYSMGGPIAQLAWQRHPDRVAALVMYATAARFGMSGISSSVLRAAAPVVSATLAVARPMLAGALRPAAAVVVDGDTAEPDESWFGSFAHHDLSAIVDAAGEILAYDARPWLAAVDVPAAVIVTTRDRVVPAERQRELAELLPTAGVIELDGTHRLPFSDPLASSAAVLDACRIVVPTTAPDRPSRRRDRIRAAWRRWRTRRRG